MLREACTHEEIEREMVNVAVLTELQAAARV
jgi:hypothetical protein